MLTKAEALNKLNEIKRNTQHNGYMWVLRFISFSLFNASAFVSIKQAK